MMSADPSQMPTAPRPTASASPLPSPVPHPALAPWIKQTALEIGFDLAGITTLAPSSRPDYIRNWFSGGHHATMDYLLRHAPVKLDPQTHWPWVKSVIVLGLHYDPPQNRTPSPPPPAGSDQGKIAAYARGRDYHRVMAGLLKTLAAALRSKCGTEFQSVAGVDATPLLEREMAARAGLGWIGKNTMVIHPKKGSWFVLGELLTNLDLPSDSPLADHCGTCTRCINACPTAALTPYQMDARRCISYQLIENRGEIPPSLHEPIRDAGYLVGCDICQSVCPHNSKAVPIPHSPGGLSRDGTLSLQAVLDWDDQEWDRRTRGRATRRVKLPMWKRNAEILLGHRDSQ
ncbi:MAG: tRNA epoxyqueuosine(34) reductase QueG [Phycisphaerae bacterium]